MSARQADWVTMSRESSTHSGNDASFQISQDSSQNSSSEFQPRLAHRYTTGDTNTYATRWATSPCDESAIFTELPRTQCPRFLRRRRAREAAATSNLVVGVSSLLRLRLGTKHWFEPTDRESTSAGCSNAATKVHGIALTADEVKYAKGEHGDAWISDDVNDAIGEHGVAMTTNYVNDAMQEHGDAKTTSDIHDAMGERGDAMSSEDVNDAVGEHGDAMTSNEVSGAMGEHGDAMTTDDVNDAMGERGGALTANAVHDAIGEPHKKPLDDDGSANILQMPQHGTSAQRTQFRYKFLLQMTR